MRWGSSAAALLLAALPAKADLFQDASNADLPWNLTTDNNSTLNGGIKILNGYTGPIVDPSGVPFFTIRCAGLPGAHVQHLPADPGVYRRHWLIEARREAATSSRDAH